MHKNAAHAQTRPLSAILVIQVTDQ